MKVPFLFFSLSLFFFLVGGEVYFSGLIFSFFTFFLFHLVYGVTGGPPDNRRMGCEFSLLLLFFIHPK